jgi:hypothetical protein
MKTLPTPLLTAFLGFSLALILLPLPNTSAPYQPTCQELQQ